MWLIRLSLSNPYLVASLVFAILLGGVLSCLSIAIDILPVFRSPAVQVLTYCPGMPASAVEKTITNRIERWVNQAPGARLVESRSVPGVSVVKIYFRDDINPNEALTLTKLLEFASSVEAEGIVAGAPQRDIGRPRATGAAVVRVVASCAKAPQILHTAVARVAHDV